MMKKSRGYLMIAGMLVIPGVVTLAAGQASGLNEMLELARSETYATAESSELLQVEESFRHWLEAGDRLAQAQDNAASGFNDLGLDASAVLEPGLVALSEQPEAQRGRGFFAARITGGTPMMIQAPHQYHDLRTGLIAQKLFLESQAVAAAWNTVHRYETDDSDPVHIPDSYLHAMSRAFADTYPDGRIVQLHGFSAAKRTTAAGREAQAILSDGSRYPPRSLILLGDCLSQQLGIAALVYPHDVLELGATTNTLASDLRSRGFEGFVHLELDADLRMRLVSDLEARNTLMGCLADMSQ